MYYVYILRSIKDNGLYIGCTTDLQKRLAAHNSGKTSSLKHRRPLEIVYVERYTAAETAYERERKLKSYKGGEALKKLLHGGFA